MTLQGGHTRTGDRTPTPFLWGLGSGRMGVVEPSTTNDSQLSRSTSAKGDCANHSEGKILWRQRLAALASDSDPSGDLFFLEATVHPGHCCMFVDARDLSCINDPSHRLRAAFRLCSSQNVIDAVSVKPAGSSVRRFRAPRWFDSASLFPRQR